MLNFIASVIIPPATGFNGVIHGFLQGLLNIVGNYGVAIILFTIILRLILLPIDFLNKYFTKRNAAKMAEFKDEDAELKAQYAADPMKYLAARREMHRRNGYKGGPAMLIMVANLIITLFVFMTVFGCLNTISTHNINLQSKALYQTYTHFKEDPDGEGLSINSEEFRTELNIAYERHNSSFLWVHNIFRPDTWSSKIPSFEQFKRAVDDETITQESYNIIFSRDDVTGAYSETGLYKRNSTGWNGILILIVLSPVTMFFSMQVNTAAMQKKKAAEAKKEAEVGYSMRQAKAQTDPTMPQVDPQKMMKYMRFIMPAVMLYFAIQWNAAFALYITIGSVIQTSLGFGSNFIIDTILNKQEKKKKDAEPNHPVINPHTRYFKKRG